MDEKEIDILDVAREQLQAADQLRDENHSDWGEELASLAKANALIAQAAESRRIANALERIADALEAADARDYLAESVRIFGTK